MTTAPAASHEETRLALASAAARAERQNQPRAMLYGAGLLMLIALIYVGVNLLSSGAARSELTRARKQANLTIEQAGKLKSLREAAAAEGPNPVQQATQVRGRIEQASVEVGIKPKGPLIPQTRTERAPGANAVQTKFDYELKDEDLSKLLAWMEHAVAAVPGLEVYSVSIRPEQHLWVLRVTYSRWEKAGE